MPIYIYIYISFPDGSPRVTKKTLSTTNVVIPSLTSSLFASNNDRQYPPTHPTLPNTFIIHLRASSLFASNNERHHPPHPTPPFQTHSSSTEAHHLCLQVTTNAITHNKTKLNLNLLQQQKTQKRTFGFPAVGKNICSNHCRILQD